MSEELVGLIMLLFSVVMLAPLCIGVTRAAADGRLLHNGGAGIRTKKTTRSAAAWQAGHRAALPVVGRLWWVAAGTVIVAGLVHWQARGSWAIGVGLVGMAVEAVVIFWSAHVAGQAANEAGYSISP